MAFNSNIGRQSFSAGAGQTDFTFNFKIFTETDIKVYLTPVGQDPNDSTDILALGSDYTIIIDGDNGGTVTLLSAATLNDSIVCIRDLPKTRSTSYVANGDLRADTLNTDQDYQTYLLIDGFDVRNRAIVLPNTDVTMARELPYTVPNGFLKAKADSSGFEYSLFSGSDFEDFVTVNTFDELDLVDTNIFTTAVVKDIDGGGIFIYTPSKSTINDGYSTIDGWVRQHSRYEVIADDDNQTSVIWKHGKVYQNEGAIQGDYLKTWMHDYRPLTPFKTDGGNLFIGGAAGNLTMSPDVGAIGNYSIQCSYNTGVGTQALGQLTTGYNNACFGVNAGRYTSQGFGNTYVGRDAGHNNTVGVYNTAIGQSALFANVTGNYNVGLGSGAILANTEGSSNIAIGYRAGLNSTTGSNNILIGDNSATGLVTGSSNTIIGKDVNIGDVSNTVLISAGTTKRVYIDSTGKVGFNGVAPSAPLEFVTSDVTAYNPTATDGQVGNGAGLYLYQNGSFGNSITQLIMRPRGAQPFNRIVSSGGATPFMAFCTNNSERLRISSIGDITPYVDNTQKLGSATNRFSEVFAGAGTINTSDDREKTYIDILDVEKTVALELKANMRKFKYNDAIEVKGIDGARIHFGASAQTVKSIFEKYDLVAEDYAILCYDEWEAEYEQLTDTPVIYAEDGKTIIADETYKKGKLLKEAGNRYGLRYDELLSFIIGAM